MTTKEFFCATWANEMELTLNAFRSVPESAKSYQPHPKARTAQQLVDHISAHVPDLIEATESMAVNHNMLLSYPSIADATEQLQLNSEKLLKSLAQIDDSEWDNKILGIFVAGHKLFEMNLRDFCFRWLVNVIHHRGQLSTYYRAMGTVPPVIYGPTAEQTEAMFAQVA